MTRVDINTVEAGDLHSAARATLVMHSNDIGVTCLGNEFHLFDLRDDKAVVKMPVKQTPPDRLLAHFKGFIQNRQN